jgi:putative transposase
MPRSVRHEYAGAVCHVMCRGNNGQSIFEPFRPLGWSEERPAAGKKGDGQRLFLSTLEEACQQTGWRVHAYVLMSNHYHLLLETPEANLVAGMKWFQGTYTQRFNAMFRCRGHLFQGRYKSLAVEADASYFRAVGNYIHLNPFRAGLAGEGFEKKLEEYEWSSYTAYTGRCRGIPDWLVQDRLLSACGLDPTSPKSRAAYRSQLLCRMRGEVLPDGVDDLAEKQLHRGWFIGTERFREWLVQQLPGRSDNLRGEQRRAHDEYEAERLLSAALTALNMTEDELLALRYNRPEKQSVVWLLKSHTTVSGVWLADRLRMGSRANVSRALMAVSRGTEANHKALKKKMTQCAG